MNKRRKKSLKTAGILPVLTKSEIKQKLATRKLEDKSVIDSIERFFLKKRGFAFKMPRKGTAVILMLSGGLDSVIVWDILMRKYGLIVYPLHLRRGQIRMFREEKAVKDLAEFYKKEHPKLFREPKIVNAFIPPLEFRFEVTSQAEVIVNKKTKQMLGVPMYGPLMANYAVNYGVFLEVSKKIKPRNIFFGFVEKDGTGMKYETVTALRLAAYQIVNITGDMSWQVSSIPIEKELGFLFDKDPLVEWAKKYSLPIEKTFSCLKLGYFHCGRCNYCYNRNKAIKKINGKDKTTYIYKTSRFEKLIEIVDRGLSLALYLAFLARVWFGLLVIFLRIYFRKRDEG